MQNQRTPTTGRTMSKGAKRRLRLLLIFVGCMILWFGAVLWHQHGLMEEKSIQLAALDKQNEEQTKLNEQFKRELLQWQDPEFREQYARKDLHMAKPGETPFAIPKNR